MSARICRLCLTIDEPLEKLNTKLLGHYKTFCKYESRSHSLLLSCLECMEALRKSLDFTNKCIKAYEIFHEWKNNGLKKKPINSLKDLLLISVNNMNIEKDEHCKTRSENNYKIKIGTVSQQVQPIKVENEYKINENIHENNDIFEVVDCDVIKYKVNNIKYEQLNKADEQNNEQILYYQNKCEQSDQDMKNDSQSQDDDDDDKFLIERVKKTEAIVKKGPRVYPRKGINDFARYESVFDIQLFDTDDDARAELQSRLSSEPYTSAKYRCERCYTVYKCEKLLQFHMKWHDSAAEVECDICRMRFANKRVLLGHKMRCHRGKFTCRLCPLITYYGSAMKAHFEKHQGKTYKCHCGGVFKHISSYLTHKRKTHARTSTHVCVTCARSFVSRLGLLNHRSRAHQTRSLEDSAAGGVACSLCELTFPNQRVLNVHVLSTHKLSQAANDIIACRYCGLTFEDAVQLKQHKREEHPTPSRDRYAEAKRSSGHKMPAASKQDCCYTCDECGAEGNGRMWRLQHYRKEHPQIKYKASEDAAQHMCEQCGRLFSSIYVLRDHLNTHLGLRPWACRSCPRTFSSYGARAQHEVRHGAPLACPYCTARFHSTSGLCMHKRRHVGARTHVCSECGRAFLLAAQLREHVGAVHQHRRRRQPPRDRRAAPTYHKPLVTRIQL